MFSNFFVSCFNSADSDTSFSEGLVPRSPVQLSTFEYSDQDVFYIIGLLHSTTAPGPDNTSIAPHLSCIFNSFLSSGKVPAEWKVSRITPAYNKVTLPLSSTIILSPSCL